MNYYLKILGVYATGIAFAGALAFFGTWVIDYSERSHAVEAINANAEVLLDKVDTTLNLAFLTLNRLSHNGNVSCTGANRQQFLLAIQSTPWINMIGIVNSGGALECTGLGGVRKRPSVLPKYQPGHPKATIALLGENRQNHALLLSLHVANGKRLIARVPKDVVSFDPVGHRLRPHRYAALEVVGSAPWFSFGIDFRENGGELLLAQKSSRNFPISAVVAIPEKTIKLLNPSIRRAFGGLCVGLFFCLMFVCYRLTRVPAGSAVEMVRALSDGQFVPYYQPIVNLEDGTIIGCEVLARWIRRDGVMISPAIFIPIAEKEGLTSDLTNEMMLHACHELSAVVKEGIPLKIAINLFTSQLTDQCVIEDVRTIFDKSPIDYEDLIFEITERSSISDMAQAKVTIGQLKTMGCQVALDDMGTGHNGLVYLTEFGADILKIDKVFIDSLGKAIGGKTIVNTFVEMAGNLGMGIIAEGVETDDQVRELLGLGVSTGQGFLYSPAVPIKEFVEQLRVSNKNDKVAA
ncbi:MAG: EAL domain-containing protein [Cohaesibacteraceae bacterium]|nr:EAL domain-containing protein [Cohaesibacteraceae bacterium]MBL4875786.1 EAL domain-containing protein [Cohaesibacteraceae bacterium]